MTAGEQLKAWRKAQPAGGMTRQYFAQQMRCDPSSVTQWEKGNRIPSMAYRILIEQFTKLSRDIWES